jgi:hypothetical protein
MSVNVSSAGAPSVVADSLAVLAAHFHDYRAPNDAAIFAQRQCSPAVPERGIFWETDDLIDIVDDPFLFGERNSLAEQGVAPDAYQYADTVYWGLKRLLSEERASRVASPGR